MQFHYHSIVGDESMLLIKACTKLYMGFKLVSVCVCVIVCKITDVILHGCVVPYLNSLKGLSIHVLTCANGLQCVCVCVGRLLGKKGGVHNRLSFLSLHRYLYHCCASLP